MIFGVLFTPGDVFADSNVNTSEAISKDYPMYKEECKEIIAMNPATKGEYNLHMKVRDPSRHDVQVLFICEPGYQYTYHHPQSGETMDFTVERRFIGTTSINDKPPEIMKPGMVLTDSGISYGTNDCPTLMYTNPTNNAWDDFDWIRYAYQVAETEDEAVELLTKDAVDEMHATGIGETLYVVGPNKGYAIEADAYNYHVEEIEDVYIKSNYPEFLWDVCSSDQYKYAPHFETMYDDWARERQIIKLGPKCTLGITIKKIENDHIIAKAFPGSGEEIKINVGENQTLNNFRIGLVDTSGSIDSPSTETQQKRAHVTICFKYLEWLEHVSGFVDEKKGDIELRDLMNWSRLHSEELGGLRAFCEGEADNEEAVNIFRHQKKEPELMSSLWFSGIPCCSIYIPVHICARRIAEPYTTSRAWQQSLFLLNEYDHGVLTPTLEKIENIIIIENDEIENICYKLLGEKDNTNIIDILTYSDNMLQFNANKMGQILVYLPQLKVVNTEIFDSINNMWEKDYFHSLKNMKNILNDIKSNLKDSDSGSNIDLKKLLSIDILEILRYAAMFKINEAVSVSNDEDSGVKKSRVLYDEGLEHIKNEKYSEAGEKFYKAFEIANCVVKGEKYPFDEQEQTWIRNSFLIVSGLIIFIVVMVAIVKWRKGKFKDRYRKQK